MSALIVILVLPLVLVTSWLALELLAGLSSTKVKGGAIAGKAVAIVIPAHDEEKVIGDTIARLKAELGAEEQILVIADNCGDRTAEAARETGVIVAERHEPQRSGKGFALAFARDLLAKNPPDAVVVIDADCSMSADDLRDLAGCALAHRRPCQAANLLIPFDDAPLRVAVSNFAFMIKNLVRQRGLQRLAGNVHLTGTGMAFPWGVFARAPIASPSIVEDLALGLDLAQHGRGALLVDHATVWSDPASEASTLNQRSRWEGGYLATALHAAPSMARAALRHADVRLLAFALSLLVPPLAMLVGLDLLAIGAVAAYASLTGEAGWAVALLAVPLVVVMILLVAAWYRHGRRYVSLRQLVLAPLYLVWKLPMYARLLVKGRPGWTRTGR